VQDFPEGLFGYEFNITLHDCMTWLVRNRVNNFGHIGPQCRVPRSMNIHFDWLWREQSYWEWTIYSLSPIKNLTMLIRSSGLNSSHRDQLTDVCPHTPT
jgi:hypothetical protein